MQPRKNKLLAVKMDKELLDSIRAGVRETQNISQRDFYSWFKRERDEDNKTARERIGTQRNSQREIK